MVHAVPPKWSSEDFDKARSIAQGHFKAERVKEPLEAYLDSFEDIRDAVEELLELTVDLADLRAKYVEVLTSPASLAVVRYLASPPISADDLKVLAEASLAAGRLKDDPDMAARIIDTVLMGLDRNRFPWVSEEREPTDTERVAAVTSTAALMASRRVMTTRANESKSAQEAAVKACLEGLGFAAVSPRDIETMTDAPGPNEFCGESPVAGRKADIVVRLHDGRLMLIECKVSNSSTNSVKRLNNDAQAKATHWLGEFGPRNVVPVAVLAGVFKRHNLEAAQAAGLTIVWAHDLGTLADFVSSTAA